MGNLEQFFLLLTAVAGSTAIWKFFETRLKTKAEEKRVMYDNSDSNQYRADLKERVEKLQQDLEEASRSILELTKKVAELETENKYLKKEIDILKSR